MVTIKKDPPPAYTGDLGPSPAYGTQQQQRQQQPGQPKTNACCQAYSVYWGFCFGTLITWIFAVAAAADDAYLSSYGTDGGGYEDECIVYYGDDDKEEICDLFEAARACQYFSTVIISVVLVLVVFAAFMPSPVTGKLGLAAGIMLALFAVFQLVAFACMAAVASKFADFTLDEVEGGPTLGVAAVSWILGLVGAIVILFLRPRATSDQDGPFRKCMSRLAEGTTVQAPPAAGVHHAVRHV